MIWREKREYELVKRGCVLSLGLALWVELAPEDEVDDGPKVSELESTKRI